ncbi:MAG: MAPEG family protein [Hyphomonadaceae bacterium]
MPATAIFQPAAVLALWTLLVLFLIPFRRFRAAAAKRVTAEDFRFGESARVPADVSVPNRAWMNLLEAPVLFYVACMIWHAIGQVTDLVVAIAWTYVGLRIVHTLVHVTYNNVFHRLSIFALSNLALTVFWILLAVALWSAPAT